MSKAKPLPSQTRVKELFDYDAESGDLVWKDGMDRGLKGSRAGYLGSGGYRLVKIDRLMFTEHSIIWLLNFGAYLGEIDHINGDRSDNRLHNLRTCSRAENMQNQGVRSDNTTGVPGVGWHKARGKFQARIWENGKARSLGYFVEKSAAEAAYLHAKIIVHSFNPTIRETSRRP